MILIALAALAAAPAVDAELTRIEAAVPEAAHISPLPSAISDWLAHLPTPEQRDVALLVMLSYAQPAGKSGPSTIADIAMGLAYVAAQTAQNQDQKRSPPAPATDSPAPMRAPTADLRAERTGRAQRALAWGHRLGLCDAAFVAALRALPPPAASGAPDFRPVVSDLGMLAYNPDCADTQQH